MFRREVKPFGDVMNGLLRDSGLETPLQQKRLLDAWDNLPGLSSYTQNRYIKNQTLFVKITSPAMRAELSMRKSELVQKLNSLVGGFVIAEIRIY